MTATRVIAVTTVPQHLTLRSPGGVVEVRALADDSGRLLVEVNGEGDCAVWVQTDLVLGGED